MNYSKDWLTKARELFPELQESIFEEHQYGTPAEIWIDIFSLLSKAYDEQPVNDDLIGRTYDYANWCFAQPQTENAQTDLSSAAAVGLIESIPLDPKISQDLYRWISVESFQGFESLFRYHLGEEENRALRDDFLRKKKAYSGPSRL